MSIKDEKKKYPMVLYAALGFSFQDAFASLDALKADVEACRGEKVVDARSLAGFAELRFCHVSLDEDGDKTAIYIMDAEEAPDYWRVVPRKNEGLGVYEILCEGKEDPSVARVAEYIADDIWINQAVSNRLVRWNADSDAVVKDFCWSVEGFEPDEAFVGKVKNEVEKWLNYRDFEKMPDGMWDWPEGVGAC